MASVCVCVGGEGGTPVLYVAHEIPLLFILDTIQYVPAQEHCSAERVQRHTCVTKHSFTNRLVALGLFQLKYVLNVLCKYFQNLKIKGFILAL